MSKRFLNSEIWDKEEFLDSSPEQKLLFFYVVQRCNNIGIFDISLKMASFQLGFEVTKEKVLSIPSDIEELKDGTFWLPKFCQHQYGELSETCKPHLRYISDLKKMGLFERVCKGYTKGIQTLEEKEEEKEQEKDKEKEEEIHAKKKFLPPTILEVEEYARGRAKGVSPSRFWHSYDVNNWMVGKNKMKDWKKAFVNWEVQGWGQDDSKPEKKQEWSPYNNPNPYKVQK